MSFLEKYKNPAVFPTGVTNSNCMDDYFRNNGLCLGKGIGEGSYSKVRLCMVTDQTDGSQEIIACKVTL